MIVLVAVGAMNIPVMVTLAGVILIEKVWRHGTAFSRVIGVSLLVIAALMLIFPSLVPGLTATPMSSM
jgi:predicted metal-binding membrane protein